MLFLCTDQTKVAVDALYFTFAACFCVTRYITVMLQYLRTWAVSLGCPKLYSSFSCVSFRIN